MKFYFHCIVFLLLTFCHLECGTTEVKEEETSDDENTEYIDDEYLLDATNATSFQVLPRILTTASKSLDISAINAIINEVTNLTLENPNVSNSPSGNSNSSPSVLAPAFKNILNSLCNRLYRVLVYIQNESSKSSNNLSLVTFEPQPDTNRTDSSSYADSSFDPSTDEAYSSEQTSDVSTSTHFSSYLEASSALETNLSIPNTSLDNSSSSTSEYSNPPASPSSFELDNSTEPYDPVLNSTSRHCRIPDFYDDSESASANTQTTSGSVETVSTSSDSLSNSYSSNESSESLIIQIFSSQNPLVAALESSVSESLSEISPSSTLEMFSKIDHSSDSVSTILSETESQNLSSQTVLGSSQASFFSFSTPKPQITVAPSEVLEECEFDFSGEVISPVGDCSKSCVGDREIVFFKNDDGTMNCCCVLR